VSRRSDTFCRRYLMRVHRFFPPQDRTRLMCLDRRSFHVTGKDLLVRRMNYEGRGPGYGGASSLTRVDRSEANRGVGLSFGVAT